jgi:hypothetical protein
MAVYKPYMDKLELEGEEYDFTPKCMRGRKVVNEELEDREIK